MTGTFAPQAPALTLEIGAIKRLSDPDQFQTRISPRGPAQRDGEVLTNTLAGRAASACGGTPATRRGRSQPEDRLMATAP